MDFDALLAAATDDTARLGLLIRQGAAVARTGQLEQALGIATRAEELAQRLGSVRELGRSGCIRATCDYLRADYHTAHKRCLESCTIAENSGDRDGFAAALLLAAACQYQMGAFEESHTALLQVLDIVAEAPDDELAFRAHNMLGMIFSNGSEHAAAESHFERAIAAGSRMGSEFYLQRVRVNRAGLSRTIGLARRSEGREAEALARFREGAAACEAMRADARGFASPENAAGCAGVLGEIYLQLGRVDEALGLFDEMLRHGAAMENLAIQAEALLHMGRHYAKCGDDAAALDRLERSVEMAASANARRMVVDAHEALAQWCERRGEPQEALRRYKLFHQLSVEHLSAELTAASRVRALWHDFQQARREARSYRERFESLTWRSAPRASRRWPSKIP